MPSKLKAWLKAKLGFGGSSIPYKKFKDEHGSTSEEVKVEPMIYVNVRRRSSSHSYFIDAFWTQNLVNKICCGPNFVIPASICVTCHVSGCLDHISSHINHSLDTIKCIFSTALQRLFGLQVWSYQPLPELHQVYIKLCNSTAVWTTSFKYQSLLELLSILRLLPLRRCFNYKFCHIFHYLNSNEVYLKHYNSETVLSTNMIISIAAWTS
ncbi:hypothetical protein TNCT_329631 [Trichonephila clavata]|uniref:Uncharacterized protein n=1 Tax=Trichonephila clavata TaxID=2740835 RepID=A0A8X6JB84_TRICU|nr:hypothetical protein TNCT_329631 [Trichonephila clavata]